MADRRPLVLVGGVPAELPQGDTVAGASGGGSATGYSDLTVTAPATPPANTMRLFVRYLAGRLLPAFIGPTGQDTTLQPHIIRNAVAAWRPSGNSATAPATESLLALTVLGTATARNVATTSRFTRMRRLGYVSAATAAAFSGHYQTVAQVTIGTGSGDGGFTLVARFGCSDAATVAGARQFVGLSSSVAAPTNVEPSTLTNCIGVGHGAADTNLKLYYGGSVAQAAIDLGASFPVNSLSVDPYELALFASTNNQNVGWRVENLRTGAVAEGMITNTTPGTTLPLNTALLAYRAWRTNNATALAVGLDVMRWGVETDN